MIGCDMVECREGEKHGVRVSKSLPLAAGST